MLLLILIGWLLRVEKGEKWVVEGEEFVEEVCDVLISQSNPFQLMSIVLKAVTAAAALEV